MGISALGSIHARSMRLRSLFRGTALDRELDEELQFPPSTASDRDVTVARGLSPDAARRDALLAIGGVEQRKEECRDTRRVRLVERPAPGSRDTPRGRCAALRHSRPPRS